VTRRRTMHRQCLTEHANASQGRRRYSFVIITHHTDVAYCIWTAHNPATSVAAWPAGSGSGGACGPANADMASHIVSACLSAAL
jgi:hypothetical protein